MRTIAYCISVVTGQKDEDKFSYIKMCLHLHLATITAKIGKLTDTLSDMFQ